MERKIVKAKLKNDDAVKVEFEDIIGDAGRKDDTIKNCGSPAHSDLVAAFLKLRIHYAVSCEEGSFSEFNDHKEKLDKFVVRQAILGGEGDQEGVTLAGHKRVKNGKVINFNSPFLKFNLETSDYEHAELLDMDIKALWSEIALYLDGKYAELEKEDENQLDMFGDNKDKGPRRKRLSKTPASVNDNGHDEVIES
ncbi:MAG: hypothetical protein WKF87_06665 [Chryseolinea sp.]